MSRLRSVLELARGDFLERARRYSFLVTLAAAAYLAYTVQRGWWLVRIGDFAPAEGPAQLGMLVAVATGTMLSLVGFYVVKGSVDRDRTTGVGPILAATPLSHLQYAASKFVSNLAVLASMLAVLTLLALGMTAGRGDLTASAVWSVAAPIVLVTGPAMAFVAGLALLFDSVPWLRGAAGNVLYFFVWTGLLSTVLVGSPAVDLTGFGLVQESLMEALRAAHPESAAQGFTVQLRPGGLPETTRFPWSGVDWSAVRIAWRLYWVAAGVGLAALGSVLLRVFDPYAEGDTAPDPGEDAEVTAAGPGIRSTDAPSGLPAASASEPDRRRTDGFSVSTLPAPRRAGGPAAFLRTTLGELRLLLAGHAWWWYGALVSATVAAFVVPPGQVGTPLLLSWLLPVAAWSSLGCRERTHGTEQMLFSSPAPLARQLPAQLAAGVLLALLAASGPLLRWALLGDTTSLAAAGSGALFVPALAVSAGAWSGSSRLFEALYVVLWYIGPLNGVPQLDFMGVTGRAFDVGASGVFLAAAVALVAAGWAGRSRRLHVVG